MLTTLLLSALLPFTLANPVPRDANSIVASINSVESYITTLNNTLNTFNEGDLASGLKVLKIQSQTDDLGNSISSATDTASASAPLDSDDSFTVASAVISLQPKVISLIDNIVAHKPAFDEAILDLVSVTPQVESDLKTQNASTAALSDAITAKLADPYPSLAGTVTGPIFTAFNNAIATFATSGGVVSLPPLPIRVRS